MSHTPETELSTPAAKGPLFALRSFVRSRRFKGLGLLLFYCHMLMLFAFMGRLYLPGVTDLAAAIGVSQAWQTENVQSALEIINNVRSGIGAVKNSTAEVAPDAALADALGQLPDLNILSGAPLAGKISSALVPIMFLLTMLGLLSRFFFKISLWLGLGQAAFCFILLGRAALSLSNAPDLYISCLTPKLQSFATGGCFIWLAALLALCALLAVTARAGRQPKNVT